MNRTPLRDLTRDEIAAYARDGVLYAKGLFDRAWIERMRQAALRDMESPGPCAHEVKPRDGRGRFFMDVFMWRSDPDFRAFVFESPAAEIAGQVMSSTRVNFFYDHLFVKDPGTQAPTCWHNDLPFWPLRGEHIISIWLALSPVTRDTSGVEYVRGSHRWGKWYKAITPMRDPHYEATHLEECPDFSTMRDRHDVVSWDMEPGDVLLHHALTVHGASGNSSLTERRIGLATRWTGDGVVFDPRPATLKINDHGLEEGDPLGGEQFPQVWGRPV
jgi:ectoine hydroxylase-related dioxygenase (phytanoyl-CoA dioxygenase family)